MTGSFAVRDDHFPGSGVRNEANQIAQCHTNPLQFLKGGPIEVIRIVGDQFDFRFPLFDLRNGHAFLELVAMARIFVLCLAAVRPLTEAP